MVIITLHRARSAQTSCANGYLDEFCRQGNDGVGIMKQRAVDTYV